MYRPISTPSYDKSYKKLIKGDRKNEEKAKKAVKVMRTDPFYPSLKTHKVNTRTFGKKWSSRITGDLRIIWDFDENSQKIILLLAVTTHSGSQKEYK